MYRLSYTKRKSWRSKLGTALGAVMFGALSVLVAGAYAPNTLGGGQANASTTNTTIEDTTTGTTGNSVQYLGSSWTHCGNCGPSGSSFYYSTTAGAQLTVHFSGTQITVYGVAGAASGMTSVALDGTMVTSAFDLYAATQKDVVVYTSPTLAPGNHTVTLTLLSQKNAKVTSAPVLAFEKATVTQTTPDAILYGKAGTFGNLGTSLPTGQTLQTQAVTNWGFQPGESAFFTALASDGEVVIGANSQTDNEVYATADHMGFGVFNPAQNSFSSLRVPTTATDYSDPSNIKPLTTATNPFLPVGGATVDGITPITVNGQQRIAFISAVNYNGWDTSNTWNPANSQYGEGEYPQLGYLDTANGVTYNASLSKTADQIKAYGGLSASACPSYGNIFGQQVANCRGMSEMGVLPLSQKFVVSQYFPDTANGQQSGRVVVMNTDGSIAASYTYPNISNGAGGYYTVNPREVDVDPTSTGNLEYFSVIFDVANNGTQSIFPIQEFSYNRTTNVITPVSKPIISGQTNGTSQYRFETAKYDSLGNLWVTQAVPNSLAGGPIVVYSKVNGTRKLETSCAAAQPWTGAGWNTVCAPDLTASNTGSYGQTRSFVQDPQSKTMFAATLNGYLLRVKQTGSGSGLALTTLSPVNFNLDQLADRTTHYIGVRKGVVDVQNRALYVPVVQVANPTDCPTWPGTTPCAPKALDQWLYRFDLNSLAQ